MAGFKSRILPTGQLYSQPNESTVWEDLQVALETTRRGAANLPGFDKILDDGAGSVGVYATLFSPTSREDVFFSVQFKHAWKIGSVIEPHIHWVTTSTDTGTVRWGLEYAWCDIFGNFGNTNIIYSVNGTASGTAGDHMYSSFGGVIPSGITGVSSMMMCRLFRDAGDVLDTYADDAAGLEFDIHIQKDAVGSFEMLTKGTP